MPVDASPSYMSDYAKIARAIAFIRDHVAAQPSLDEIAASVHLSPYHFQRLFGRWAGVTPKRFLQVLTLEHAKELLRDGRRSVLDVTYAVGLGSGSRLYDHFVHLEAVTPSEFRQAGRGLSIAYGYHATPYGDVFVAGTERGICALEFVEAGRRRAPLARLRQVWRLADFVEDAACSRAAIDALFAGTRRDGRPLSVWVRGTNFQINVWKALLRIQPGQVATYAQVAHALGRPDAARAVGTAVAANRIGLLIPCHRVIRRDGALGGYRWGEVRKHAILARETAGGG